MSDGTVPALYRFLVLHRPFGGAAHNTGMPARTLTPARVRPGVPAGGQFTAQQKNEAEATLPAWAPGVGIPHPAGGYDDVSTNDAEGKILYSRRGELYRTDGPAVILPDGTCEWYERPGLLHRDGDQPAVVASDGVREWRVDGVLHRENGPAILLDDGAALFYRHGLLHRDGGQPAVSRPDGRTEWWEDGLRHREDGPALIEPDGTETFYFRGRKLGGGHRAHQY